MAYYPYIPVKAMPNVIDSSLLPTGDRLLPLGLRRVTGGQASVQRLVRMSAWRDQPTASLLGDTGVAP